MIDLDNILDYLMQTTIEEMNSLGITKKVTIAKGPRCNRVVIYNRPIAYAFIGFNDRVLQFVHVPNYNYSGGLDDHDSIRQGIRNRLSQIFRQKVKR